MDCIHSFPIDLKLNGVPNWFRIGRKMVNALRFADSGGSTLGFLVRSLTINFSLRRFFFSFFNDRISSYIWLLWVRIEKRFIFVSDLVRKV